MNNILVLFSSVILAACVGVQVQPPQQMSDQDIAARRANIQALDNADYNRNRARRQDSIEDLGTMQMNEAEAINKSRENSSKQKITIIH